MFTRSIDQYTPIHAKSLVDRESYTRVNHTWQAMLQGQLLAAKESCRICPAGSARKTAILVVQDIARPAANPGLIWSQSIGLTQVGVG